MVKITFLSNEGSGFSDYKIVEDNTTIRDFVASNQSGDPNNFLVRVNRQEVPADYVLREGDRVSITPSKIKAA